MGGTNRCQRALREDVDELCGGRGAESGRGFVNALCGRMSTSYAEAGGLSLRRGGDLSTSYAGGCRRAMRRQRVGGGIVLYVPTSGGVRTTWRAVPPDSSWRSDIASSVPTDGVVTGLYSPHSNGRGWSCIQQRWNHRNKRWCGSIKQRWNRRSKRWCGSIKQRWSNSSE